MPNPPLDFDLEIVPDGSNYRARVLASPGGDATAPVTLPFSNTEIENLILRMGMSRGKTRGTGDSVRAQAAKALGGGLYSAVFQDGVARCWATSLAIARREHSSLRLRLRLNDSPELADLPWEFLYDPSSLNRFFLLSRETPLIRYLALPDPPGTLQIAPPLNILLLVSGPKDEDALDVALEEKLLRDALQNLLETGMVTIERLHPPATLSNLQHAFRTNEYHILHFIGHGRFDEQRGRGLIILENEDGNGAAVDGERFARLIHDESLRLVILNSCDGARPTRSDAFGGFAQRVIQQGIPAVIAMQFAITDQAAVAFSREFYSALAANFPVEDAVAEGRKAIYALPNDTEWGTPVLYSRAPDGVLFDIRGAPQAPVLSGIEQPDQKPISSKGDPGNSHASPVQDFVPTGEWDIQVQDMVGSRLHVLFTKDGRFQMQQQVGMYQVPVNGSWTFNPLTRQLALQGVVNTFQPFILAITISGRLPNGFAAVGSDGIGYVLTRA